MGPRDVSEVPTTRMTRLIILVIMVMRRSLGLSSVARKFGHRFFRAVIVDECLAGGGGGDQCCDGGIVQCARQTQAGFVESRNGVVGKQRIVATCQCQMVLLTKQTSPRACGLRWLVLAGC